MDKMNFKECVENRIITRTDPDFERASQMVKMAEIRLKFWNKKIDDEFVALKVEAYYDIIKELIFAILYKNGFNCQNHLCLISYLKETLKDFEYEIEKIDELRALRNEINYRGFNLSLTVV